MTPPTDHVVAGKRAVAEAIRAGIAIELLVAEGTSRTPGLREALRAAAEAGVPVRSATRAVLDSQATDHQGVVAHVRPPGAGTLSERELAAFPFAADAIAVILDGVTDPQNLGAAARSAEAAGASMIVTRTRRAADVTPAAVRASAGALLHLPHARVANIPRAVERLQGVGFTVVGLADDADDGIYDRPCPVGRIALVAGDESRGLSRLARERCDVVVSIPMRGRVSSLNASASVAAALYGYVLPAQVRGPSAGTRR